MGTTASAAVLAGVLGTIVGSFLNVVAYRLPRGESLVRPGSRCPGCATPIRPYDNVPVLGWLALRGRCRSCRAAIPVRYPLVEAATGLACAAVVLRLGAEPEALLGIVLVLLLVPITLIDLDFHLIPNVLTGLGALAAVALVIVLEPHALPEHLLAGAAAGGFLLAAWIVHPAGMGMGDVKLAAVLGLFLGRAVGPAMFAALIAGSVVGAAIVARKGMAEGRKSGLPFGPWLAFGGLLGLLAGDAAVSWYLGTFS
jgi:leader peptidase (prepilin peptidase) / N-methyltransferase